MCKTVPFSIWYHSVCCRYFHFWSKEWCQQGSTVEPQSAAGPPIFIIYNLSGTLGNEIGMSDVPKGVVCVCVTSGYHGQPLQLMQAMVSLSKSKASRLLLWISLVGGRNLGRWTSGYGSTTMSTTFGMQRRGNKKVWEMDVSPNQPCEQKHKKTSLFHPFSWHWRIWKQAICFMFFIVFFPWCLSLGCRPSFEVSFAGHSHVPEVFFDEVIHRLARDGFRDKNLGLNRWITWEIQRNSASLFHTTFGLLILFQGRWWWSWWSWNSKKWCNIV